MGSESPNVILYDSNGEAMAVSNGTAIPASTSALLIAGSDGTNSRYITLDGSGRTVTVGAGVAGTPSGGVISIQGVAGGTVLPISIATPDTTATGSLNALNATVPISLAGTSGVAMQLNAGTLVGTIVPEISFDGGTTWVSTFFDDPSTGNKVSSIVFASNNTATARILVSAAGASNMRVRVSAFTSGTATCNLRGSSQNEPSILFSGSAGGVLPPTIVQVGGTDGSNLRAMLTDVSGHTIIVGPGTAGTPSGGVVSIQGVSGGTTVPVSGTVAVTQSTSPWVNNISQFGGNNVVTGTGASGVGIPRVTVSNDSNILATQSGTWTVQPGNTANTTPWLTTINQGGNSATVTASNALKVDGSAVTQPVSGTVTANIGTTNGLALDTSVNGILVSQGSTTSGEKGPLIQGAVTTSAPSYTTAQTSPLSLTTTGLLRIDGSGVTQPVSGTVTANQGTANTIANSWPVEVTDGTNILGTAAHPIRVDPTGTTTQPVSGTVTSNQGTSPWVTNVTQFGSNNVVTGTGASGVGIPRVTVSNDSNILATQSGTWTVAQGAPNTLANKWPVQVTDGTNTMPTADVAARAQFDKITDGTNTAAVKASSVAPAATDPALVVSLSPNNSLFAFGGDSRLRVGQETLLFFDNIDGTTIDVNKWTQSQSGMTQSQTGGNLTLNAGSSLTSGNYSILTSNKQMLILDEFPLYVQFRARLIPQTNAVLEIGFGNAATTATPTDGVFFRVDATGNLKGVINFNGTETTTATLGTLTASTFYNFEVTIYEDHASYEVQSSDGTTNIDVDLPIPLANGSPTSVGHLPVYVRVYNSSATSSAAQIIVASVNVQQMDLNMNKPWAEQVAGAGRSAILDPSTLSQSANYTNNTAASIATLSNTAAGYTTLGGLYRFNAPAGAETDYALFGYQVPDGAQLYIWSVTITAFITGAQSTTQPTLLQWALAANSSAVSLATGAPNPPIFLPIGMQQAPKTASIGDPFNPGTITFVPKTPLVINGGKFFHIVLRVPVGNATGSQVIRGSITVEGYFE